jgi:drug/metabolite transporter (DMT)-like permease
MRWPSGLQYGTLFWEQGNTKAWDNKTMQKPMLREQPALPAFNRQRLQIALALLAVYMFWGGTYLATKLAIASIPTYLMIGTRFLSAGALLFAVLRWRGAPSPTRAEWRGAAVMGVLLIVLGMGATASSQHLGISSSLAALGVAATPLWTALFAGLAGRWPGARDWLGLGIGFTGIVLLNAQGELRANTLGAVVLLAGAVAWALGTVIAPRLRLPTGLMAPASEMLVGGAILLLFGLLRGEQFTQLPTVSSFVAWGYLLLFGSVVGFSAYAFLLRNVRPSLATSTAYVNPIVAVALGVGFAGEQIGTLGLVAMGIIIAGVAIVVTRKNA